MSGYLKLELIGYQYDIDIHFKINHSIAYHSSSFNSISYQHSVFPIGPNGGLLNGIARRQLARRSRCSRFRSLQKRGITRLQLRSCPSSLFDLASTVETLLTEGSSGLEWILFQARVLLFDGRPAPTPTPRTSRCWDLDVIQLLVSTIWY